MTLSRLKETVTCRAIIGLTDPSIFGAAYTGIPF
jgi:hypothetical protein